MPPTFVRPQDVPVKSPNTLAEGIIQQSLDAENLEILGIGTAISLTCSTVGIATGIAKIYLKKIILDYVETALGDLEAIYFMVTTKPTTEVADTVTKLEKELTSNKAGPGGQVVLVSKVAETKRITTTCLYKMREFQLIKISGAGFAMNPAASAALQVVRLSRDPARVEAVSLESISAKESGRPRTALSIYLRQGKRPERDADFTRTLRELRIIQ
jgi:hypothetical protein